MRFWTLLLPSSASYGVLAIDDFTDLSGPQACSSPAEAALVQMRSQVSPTTFSEGPIDEMAIPAASSHIPTEMSFTTNVGQDYNECPGSAFNVDESGSYSGLVMSHGLLIAKGACPLDSVVPQATRDMVCDDSSGCHMWCAPVWNSYKDTLAWGDMYKMCTSWDGNPKLDDDPTCKKASRVYTWARSILPSNVVGIKLTFAILGQVCREYCTGLQVTVYDAHDWSKSWRWCFNYKPLEVNANGPTDMVRCDFIEEVPLGVWRERKLHLLTNFTGKFDYEPSDLAFELAVYSEFAASEVLVRSIQLHKASASSRSQILSARVDGVISHKQKKKQLSDSDTPSLDQDDPVTPEPSSATDTLHCGVISQCPAGSRCCRGESAPSCCPTNFQCCGELCCPRYYTCNTGSETGIATTSTCLPPPTTVPQLRPSICSL